MLVINAETNGGGPVWSWLLYCVHVRPLRDSLLQQWSRPASSLEWLKFCLTLYDAWHVPKLIYHCVQIQERNCKILLDQLMHPLSRCWIKQNPASRNSYWIQGAVESIRTKTQSCCTPCPCPILSILGSRVKLPLHYAPEQLFVGTINRFQWVVSARFVWILNNSVSYHLRLLMVLSSGDDPWPQTQKHTSTNNTLDCFNSLDHLLLKNTMLLFSLEFM